jgi:hypothetical protein
MGLILKFRRNPTHRPRSLRLLPVERYSRDSNETDENNKQTVEVRHGPVPCVIKPLRRKALTKPLRRKALTK